MKKFILLILLMTFSTIASSQTRTNLIHKWDGTQRKIEYTQKPDYSYYSITFQNLKYTSLGLRCFMIFRTKKDFLHFVDKIDSLQNNLQLSTDETYHETINGRIVTFSRFLGNTLTHVDCKDDDGYFAVRKRDIRHMRIALEKMK